MEAFLKESFATSICAKLERLNLGHRHNIVNKNFEIRVFANVNRDFFRDRTDGQFPRKAPKDRAVIAQQVAEPIHRRLDATSNTPVASEGTAANTRGNAVTDGSSEIRDIKMGMTFKFDFRDRIKNCRPENMIFMPVSRWSTSDKRLNRMLKIHSR